MLQNDGKFVKVLNRIADLVGLNLLAILFCIPIVTIGASITAVYGCIFRIQEKKEGYLIKDFWKLFKASFRSSTIIYLVGVLVIAMLYLDYHIFAADRTMNALQILVIAAGIIVAEIFTYAFPMESYFENTVKATPDMIIAFAFSLDAANPCSTNNISKRCFILIHPIYY